MYSSSLHFPPFSLSRGNHYSEFGVDLPIRVLIFLLHMDVSVCNIHKCFSNFHMHTNHMEILSKTRISEPTPRGSDSVGLGWTWDSAFLISSQVMLMLLDYTYTVLYGFQINLNANILWVSFYNLKLSLMIKRYSYVSNDSIIFICCMDFSIYE